jgi:hypothetical protein
LFSQKEQPNHAEIKSEVKLMYVNCTKKVEFAKYYTDLGFHVFPVHAVDGEGVCTCGNDGCKDIAKHPLTTNGFKDSTTDPEKLKEYFSGDYDQANIGLATGKASGVWVLDVDVLGSLTTLQRQYGTLPRTPTGKTGGNGLHHLFKYPDGVIIPNSQSKVADEIDVRGNGGYVILPPSNHKSGDQYRWLVSPDETPFADAPNWLLTLVTQETTAAKTASSTLTIGKATTVDERVKLYLAKTPPAIDGENGHGHTFGVVCRVFELFDISTNSDDEILALLADWNARCEPPWTEKELRQKFNSARGKVNSQGNANVNDGDEVEWPTLGEDALYGIAGEYVQTIGPASECDPVALRVIF